jgi:ribosomal protein S18 acetylase RimI-like enzyme
MTRVPPFIVEADPAQTDVHFLRDRIDEFNMTTTGIHDGGEFACFVRGAANEIVAGLYGWIWGGCCDVRYLWVREDLRQRGYGSALLAAAEREAAARGCRVVVLETHSFQAPDFYRRHGYEIVSHYEGYPAGHRKYHLRKQLP